MDCFYTLPEAVHISELNMKVELPFFAVFNSDLKLIQQFFKT